jgi:hypothetical protein
MDQDRLCHVQRRSLSRLEDIIRVPCSGWTSWVGTGLLDGGGILLARLHGCHTLASASACNSVCGRLCFQRIAQTPSIIEERVSFNTRRCGIHSVTLIRTSSACIPSNFNSTSPHGRHVKWVHLAYLRFIYLLLSPSFNLLLVVMSNLGFLADALPTALAFSLDFGLFIVILAVTKAW